MEFTKNQIASMINDYADRAIDSMDMGDLLEYAKNCIINDLLVLSDAEIVQEVEEYYPDILEEYNND